MTAPKVCTFLALAVGFCILLVHLRRPRYFNESDHLCLDDYGAWGV